MNQVRIYSPFKPGRNVCRQQNDNAISVSPKGYRFTAMVIPRISEPVWVHLDSAGKNTLEFDTANFSQEIAGFNVCRTKQTLSLQCKGHTMESVLNIKKVSTKYRCIELSVV